MRTTKISIRQSLLLCGILSSVLYIVATILGAYRWTEYDSASQTVSELIAIDAPSAQLVVPLFLLYSLSVFAFGLGIWLSAGTKKALRIVALLIVAKEVLGVIATVFAPMHLRGIAATQTDTMHGALTGIGVLLCMLPAIGFGASAFGKGFCIYSIVTIAIFLLFGTLAGMEGAKIAANQPTPCVGILERINIFTYFVWIGALTIKLLKANRIRN